MPPAPQPAPQPAPAPAPAPAPSPSQAPCKLHILIVGAGLGGLAAAIALRRVGHSITILEQAPVLGEVGAGIQIPPNSSRILISFGLRSQFAAVSVCPRAFCFRRYTDGHLLSSQPLVPYVEERYGAPYWHIHRADFHDILVAEARRLGVDIKLNARVESADLAAPSVLLKSGERMTGDLLIGADGLKSLTRELLLGEPSPPHLTGDLAYRILISASSMQTDPDLAPLATNPMINFWLGPDSHAVCYLLKGGGLYNIVLACPDNLPADVNIGPAEPGEMERFFRGWDPRLRKLIAMSHQTLKWRLQNSVEMETWTHPAGRFVLLGDACHATLPYMAQGAAMAVEDGAVLGSLLGRIERKEQLGGLLRVFEEVRKNRTTRVVKGSTHQREVFHIHDGERQRERDRVLKEDRPGRGFPNIWRDPEMQEWMFAYDAEEVGGRAWRVF